MYEEPVIGHAKAHGSPLNVLAGHCLPRAGMVEDLWQGGVGEGDVVDEIEQEQIMLSAGWAALLMSPLPGSESRTNRGRHHRSFFSFCGRSGVFNGHRLDEEAHVASTGTGKGGVSGSRSSRDWKRRQYQCGAAATMGIYRLFLAILLQHSSPLYSICWCSLTRFTVPSWIAAEVNTTVTDWLKLFVKLVQPLAFLAALL